MLPAHKRVFTDALRVSTRAFEEAILQAVARDGQFEEYKIVVFFDHSPADFSFPLVAEGLKRGGKFDLESVALPDSGDTYVWCDAPTLKTNPGLCKLAVQALNSEGL
jgi:hypothetical protein